MKNLLTQARYVFWTLVWDAAESGAAARRGERRVEWITVAVGVAAAVATTSVSVLSVLLSAPLALSAVCATMTVLCIALAVVEVTAITQPRYAIVARRRWYAAADAAGAPRRVRQLG